MTLLVSLSGHDGLVVATDSRGTFGDPRMTTAQNDSQKKLYVTTKYTAVLTAGAGEIAAGLMTDTPAVLGGIEGVAPVMQALRNHIRTQYAAWFQGFAIQPLPNLQLPVRPDIALIIAGYDLGPDGKPTVQKMYQLVSAFDFAPSLHNYGFALAGVAQYGLYLLNRLYRPNSTVNQLKALAAYVITETAGQDGKVGGRVQMATITAAQGCVELKPEEVNEIVNNNDNRSKALQDSFYADATKSS
jgi:20S proteasome alpha/beta subunit